MPTIKIDSFSGIMPRVHPTLLPDGCAVKAFNCRLKSGKLSPLRMPLKTSGIDIRLEGGLSKVSEASSIHLWRRGLLKDFLAWEGDVRVAPSNIADDDRFRIFVSGDTGAGGANHPCAYISAPVGNEYTRHSLVKTSLSAPIVSVDEPSDPDNVRYTNLFQTWVDAYGYESGPSMPSAEVEYNDGQSFTVGVTVAPPGASVRRVYKVVSGSETERIQFVTEQAAVNAYFPSFSFTVRDEDAGEVMPTFVSPPADLVWMSYIPGDFYCGFRRSNLRQVLFSDVNRPTSWPDVYMYPVKDDLVGLAAVGNTVYAITTGSPWAITGTAPESMSVSAASSPQGCVSARSICVMESSVFYASQDGICMLSPSADYPLLVPVITEKYFSKREWSELNPSSCIIATYDGALFAYFQKTDGTRVAHILDLKDGVSAITTHDEVAKAVCTDTVDDALYFVRDTI